jgi:hypothetical protein
MGADVSSFGRFDFLFRKFCPTQVHLRFERKAKKKSFLSPPSTPSPAVRSAIVNENENKRYAKKSYAIGNARIERRRQSN